MKAGKEETLLCSYTYDKLDRRVKAVVNGIKWKYKYDKYSQLIYAKAVNEGKKLIYKYKYDDIGNRLAYQFAARREFFKYNSLNQIANNGYVYDDYGNLIKTTDTDYTFDLHNRLIKVKKGNLTITYFYDPLGQRIKSVKTIEGKPSGTTLFLMSGMIEQARAKVASGGKHLASIDFHTLGLDLAGSLTATGGVGSVLATSKTQTSGYYTRTYLYDGNGNVISLCKPDTGTITANYTYSPFGKLIKSGGIDKQIADFTFSTKYADETGLSYYGFRFYSAELGRWLKRDPLEEMGNFNIYVTVLNNPLSLFDRDGLGVMKILSKVVIFFKTEVLGIKDSVKKISDFNIEITDMPKNECYGSKETHITSKLEDLSITHSLNTEVSATITTGVDGTSLVSVNALRFEEYIYKYKLHSKSTNTIELYYWNTTLCKCIKTTMSTTVETTYEVNRLIQLRAAALVTAAIIAPSVEIPGIVEALKDAVINLLPSLSI